MKNLIIGSLVTAVILFIWQFMSWGLLDLHGENMKYTPNQEKVLTALSANLEPGKYFMPRAPETASQEEMQTISEGFIGGPWAVVSYHENMQMEMGSNMVRGFILNLIIGFLLCWIFGNFGDSSFSKILLSTLAIGFIGYLVFPYLDSVWFKGHTIPELIDAIVGFGIVGAWLGWWLNR